jgi:hypothetical protein
MISHAQLQWAATQRATYRQVRSLRPLIEVSGDQQGVLLVESRGLWDLVKILLSEISIYTLVG